MLRNAELSWLVDADSCSQLFYAYVLVLASALLPPNLASPPLAFVWVDETSDAERSCSAPDRAFLCSVYRDCV